MLIAHISDTHISERDRYASLHDQVNCLKEAGNVARRAGAVAMLHGGDVFDALSTPMERLAAIEVFESWAYDMPVVVVQGNHDAPLDLDYLRSIRSVHDIHVSTRPQAIDVADDLCIATLPWPRKEFLAALGAKSQEEIRQASGNAMRAILRRHARHNPLALLGHIELGAANTDSGQPLAAHCPVRVSEHDLLDVGAEAVLLGHVHATQTLNGRIRYSGSPRQMRHGEGNEHGFTLADIDENRQRLPVFEHVSLPGPKLVTLECRLDGLLFVPPQMASDVCGSDVRLVYEVDSTNAAAARAEAEEKRDRLLRDGARSVKIDARVKPTIRVRSEEIKTASSTAERLDAWWGAVGRPDNHERIAGRVYDLEEAAI